MAWVLVHKHMNVERAATAVPSRLLLLDPGLLGHIWRWKYEHHTTPGQH